MSRSRKKHPCWSAPNSRNGIHSGVHAAKVFANRRARRKKYEDTPSGGAYRKITNPWDIRDYRHVHYTKQETRDAITDNDRWLLQKSYPNENSWGYARNKEKYRKYSLEYYYYSK